MAQGTARSPDRFEDERARFGEVHRKPPEDVAADDHQRRTAWKSRDDKDDQAGDENQRDELSFSHRGCNGVGDEDHPKQRLVAQRTRSERQALRAMIAITAAPTP